MVSTTYLLFSYGTLQLERVQIETYGRKLTGSQDSLSNFKVEQIKITDQSVLAKSNQLYHPIAVPSDNPNDRIEGVIFELTEQELLETDNYEVSDYKRVFKTFDSGTKAWIYILNQN